MPRPDPTALLCESCGYPIGELPREGNCPECGRAIAESLPERRRGTPWQRRARPGTWIGNIELTAGHPRRIWNLVRVDTESALLLLLVNTSVAAVSTCAIGAALVWGIDFTLDLSEVWEIIKVASVVAFFGSVGLPLLCAVEYAGIRFFGARREWRITHAVAMSVVGHASVGWLLLPFSLPLCWWIGAAELLEALDGVTGLGLLGLIVSVLALLAGPLVPLLAFELLVYEGVRRMKFANSEPPASGRRA